MKILRAISGIAAAFMILLCCSGCNSSGSGKSGGKEAVLEKMLDSRERELFDQLVKCMKEVSGGKRTADAFYFTASSPFGSKAEYEKSVKKIREMIRYYIPEYSFWEDSSGYRIYDTSKCGIVFGISPAYRTIDNKVNRQAEVQKALSNAKAIADKYEGKNGYDKVIGYAKEICALNEYNDEAADSDTLYYNNVDPWGMIYIFDGDPSTNSVCAGYAKAFKYLCDLGGIECYAPTGFLDGGSHAWNIVMLDGVSYFADVTNCDIFSPEDIERYHPLVMNGVADNTENGFEVFYTGSSGRYSAIYTYDKDTIEYLPEDVRTVSRNAYIKEPSKAGAVIVIMLFIALIVFYNIRKRKKLREFAARMEAQLQAEEDLRQSSEQNPEQSFERDKFPDQK